MHVHVISADGEGKFWLEPVTELAQNWGAGGKGPGIGLSAY
jgi:hypothetical protein